VCIDEFDKMRPEYRVRAGGGLWGGYGSVSALPRWGALLSAPARPLPRPAFGPP
jgi:hypothetical protein